MLTFLAGWVINKIYVLLESFVAWMIQTFNTVWAIVRTGWAWVVATILGVIAITNVVVSFVFQQISDIAVLITHVIMQDDQKVNQTVAQVESTLAIINRFVPVGEMFTLISALSLLMLSCYLYRLIKSWIPTLD